MSGSSPSVPIRVGPGQPRGTLTAVNGVLLAHAGGVHEIAVVLGLVLGPVLILLVPLLVVRRRGADENETSEERTHDPGRDADA